VGFASWSGYQLHFPASDAKAPAKSRPFPYRELEALGGARKTLFDRRGAKVSIEV